jgi:hypothetical protein
MKKLFYSLATCCLLAGCADSDRSLLESSVTLNQEPLVIVPSHSLSASLHFNVLCIAVPPNYWLDSQSLRDPNGEKVVVHATLTTTEGSKHLFTQRGDLSGRYACLQADPTIGHGFLYKEVEISSSAPHITGEIRWFSRQVMTTSIVPIA